MKGTFMIITINGTRFDMVTALSADRVTRRTDINYNTQGDMLIDLVSRKYRLRVLFGLMTEDELNALRELTREIFVTVVFPSPEGGDTEGEFHISEEPAPAVTVVNGVRMYGGVELVMLQK